MNRRHFLRTAAYSGILFSGAAVYIQTADLEVLQLEIPIKGLPKRYQGLTLGVMSDFHAGAMGTKGIIHSAIQEMKKHQPDVIMLLGDFIDGREGGQKKELFKKTTFLFSQLSELKAPSGVFAVLGNHDHWVDPITITAMLKGAGINVLSGRKYPLSNDLVIAGVDDFWHSRVDLRYLLQKEKGKTVFLLSHNPDINQEIKVDSPIRLVLSGHTHGGQVRVPFIHWAPWAPSGPKYKGTTGVIKETQSRWSFISKGVGTFFVPLRIACPPDIAILRLRAV